jgi:hypothetical protein
MKKLMLAGLLVVALAVPAGAGAKQPPKKPKTPKAHQVATKNAAWMCKTMKAANPAAFAALFGSNHNGRNAYGKCVSAHARAKHGNRAFSLRKVTVAATGTVTNAGAPGCQFTPSGCTLTSTGNLNGIVGGTYSSTLTTLWTQATPNGHGGFCAPAAGDTTLTLPGLGTLTKHESGTVCEVGVTGVNVAHTFAGSFAVTSGTGIFAGATGSGTATFTQQPGASSALGGTVNATEKFTSLVVHV